MTMRARRAQFYRWALTRFHRTGPYAPFASLRSEASGEGSLTTSWTGFLVPYDQFANTHGLANQRTIPDEHQQPFELSKAVGS